MTDESNKIEIVKNKINDTIDVLQNDDFHKLSKKRKRKIMNYLARHLNTLSQYTINDNDNKNNNGKLLVYTPKEILAIYDFLDATIDNLVSNIFNNDSWYNENWNNDKKGEYFILKIWFIKFLKENLVTELGNNSNFIKNIENTIDNYKIPLLLQQSDSYINDTKDFKTIAWKDIYDRQYIPKLQNLIKKEEYKKIEPGITELAEKKLVEYKELNNNKVTTENLENLSSENIHEYIDNLSGKLKENLTDDIIKLDNEIKEAGEKKNEEKESSYDINIDNFPIFKTVLSITVGIHLGVIYKFFTKTNRIKDLDYDWALFSDLENEDTDQKKDRIETDDTVYNAIIVISILLLIGYIKSKENQTETTAQIEINNILYTVVSALIVLFMSNVIYADDTLYINTDNILYVYVYSYVFLIGLIYYFIVNFNNYVGGRENKTIFGIITLAIGAVYIMPIFKQINIANKRIGKNTGENEDDYDNDLRPEQNSDGSGRGYFYLLFDMAMIAISIISVYIFSVVDGYILSSKNTRDNLNTFIHYILVLIFIVGLVYLPAYTVDCDGNVVSLLDIILNRSETNIDREGRNQLRILYHLVFFFAVFAIALNSFVFNFFYDEKIANEASKNAKYYENIITSAKEEKVKLEEKIKVIDTKIKNHKSKNQIELTKIYFDLLYTDSNDKLSNIKDKIRVLGQIKLLELDLELINLLPDKDTNLLYQKPDETIDRKYNEYFNKYDKYINSQNEITAEEINKFQDEFYDSYSNDYKKYSLSSLLGNKSPGQIICDLIDKLSDIEIEKYNIIDKNKFIGKAKDVFGTPPPEQCELVAVAPQSVITRLFGSTWTDIYENAPDMNINCVPKLLEKPVNIITKENEILRAELASETKNYGIIAQLKSELETERVEYTNLLNTLKEEKNEIIGELKDELKKAEQRGNQSNNLSIELEELKREKDKVTTELAGEKAKLAEAEAKLTAAVEAAKTAKAEAEAAKTAKAEAAETAKAEASRAKAEAKTALVESKGVSEGKISELTTNLKSAQQNLAAAKEAESQAKVNRAQAITNKGGLEKEINELETRIKELDSKKSITEKNIDDIEQIVTRHQPRPGGAYVSPKSLIETANKIKKEIKQKLNNFKT
tara:strand:+ start:7720 stop:11088 length:3369 start_codon:yes stop_codon:yes gene_type:complete